MTTSPPAGPTPGQLTFTAPRRAKPPRHLADLSPSELVDVVRELGLPTVEGGETERARRLHGFHDGRLNKIFARNEFEAVFLSVNFVADKARDFRIGFGERPARRTAIPR